MKAWILLYRAEHKLQINKSFNEWKQCFIYLCLWTTVVNIIIKFLTLVLQIAGLKLGPESDFKMKVFFVDYVTSVIILVLLVSYYFAVFIISIYFLVV